MEKHVLDDAAGLERQVTELVARNAITDLVYRLGVTEDAESEAIDPSDPEAPAHAVYGWLTWFENDLVETLLG